MREPQRWAAWHRKNRRVCLNLEQFALPFAREERISLKMLFATRQNLQTNLKDVLAPIAMA